MSHAGVIDLANMSREAITELLKSAQGNATRKEWQNHGE